MTDEAAFFQRVGTAKPERTTSTNPFVGDEAKDSVYCPRCDAWFGGMAGMTQVEKCEEMMTLCPRVTTDLYRDCGLSDWLRGNGG